MVVSIDKYCLNKRVVMCLDLTKPGCIIIDPVDKRDIASRIRGYADYQRKQAGEKAVCVDPAAGLNHRLYPVPQSSLVIKPDPRRSDYLQAAGFF